MIPDETKKLFLTKYSSVGNEKFYKFLLSYALNRIVTFPEMKGMSPEIELMDYYEKFLLLYRRENDNIYIDVAKQFRKAAHKIYRIMLKKDLIDKNNKFLNAVD